MAGVGLADSRNSGEEKSKVERDEKLLVASCGSCGSCRSSLAEIRESVTMTVFSVE